MATEETNLEAVIVALLKTSAGITVMPYRASEDTLPESDYIAVIVENKEPAMVSYASHVRPHYWGSRVTIAVDVATRNAAKLESIMLAVDTLMGSGVVPDAVATLAGTYFPAGLELDQTTGGDDVAENVEVRAATRFYQARWGSDPNAIPPPVGGGEAAMTYYTGLTGAAPSLASNVITVSNIGDLHQGWDATYGFAVYRVRAGADAQSLPTIVRPTTNPGTHVFERVS